MPFSPKEIPIKFDTFLVITAYTTDQTKNLIQNHEFLLTNSQSGSNLGINPNQKSGFASLFQSALENSQSHISSSPTYLKYESPRQPLSHENGAHKKDTQYYDNLFYNSPEAGPQQSINQIPEERKQKKENEAQINAETKNGDKGNIRGEDANKDEVKKRFAHMHHPASPEKGEKRSIAEDGAAILQKFKLKTQKDSNQPEEAANDRQQIQPAGLDADNQNRGAKIGLPFDSPLDSIKAKAAKNLDSGLISKIDAKQENANKTEKTNNSPSIHNETAAKDINRAGNINTNSSEFDGAAKSAKNGDLKDVEQAKQAKTTQGKPNTPIENVSHETISIQAQPSDISRDLSLRDAINKNNQGVNQAAAKNQMASQMKASLESGSMSDSSENASQNQTGQNNSSFQFDRMLHTQKTQENPALRGQLQQQINTLFQRARIQFKNNGDANLTANLYPKELGKISIKLSLTDGKLAGKLTVDNEIVQKELADKLEKLSNELTQDGFEVSGFEVDVKSGQTGSQSTDAKFSETIKQNSYSNFSATNRQVNHKDSTHEEGLYA